ncbi:AsnC family transcriptional regulator [Candidatus Bathyarchaeota archaeon]|nr:MAG: AsnC family transcriptional regulator [Candidatus Bathyarchaeota archaeon]
MTKIKGIDFKILSGLMKNSKISDRKLAEIIGVSQPTVTRRRAKLEKQAMLEYTAIPNFAKLGFEIVAISLYSWTPEANSMQCESPEKVKNKLSAFLSNHKNIIFTSNGRGFGMDRVMISVHESYSDYTELMNAVNMEWGSYLDQTKSFIISTQVDIVGRHLGFKYLAEYIVEKLKMT